MTSPDTASLGRAPRGTSQYGQDEFVLTMLNELTSGFFLDSGASDGVRCSNTYLLERQFGWHGICVEPNRAFFAQLSQNRSCHCVSCCLYDRDGSVTFLEADTLGGIVDEYDVTMLRQASTWVTPTPGGSLPTVQTPTRTVGSVLAEFGAPRVIDYWSLDTEGSELTLLRSFPFDQYAFRVITVEHNWLPVRAEIRAVLAARGYDWVTELGCDDGYHNPTLGSPNGPGFRRRLNRTQLHHWVG